MNKKEKELLTELYWWISEHKNEHYIIYYAKDVLQSILKGDYMVAENLLLPKTTPANIDEFEYKWRKHENLESEASKNEQK